MTSTPHTTTEYRQLYQFLSSKHKDILIKADQLENTSAHIDQCTNLMQMRIATLVAQLDKVNTLMNDTVTPKTSLDDLKKLQSHQEALDILSQIENSSNVDQALDLIPQHIKDLSKLPKNFNLPEVSQNWTPNNDYYNLLSTLKVNTNFNNDVSTYKDLKRKIEEYQPSEFVLMGLANQEIEAKKRKKLATKTDLDVADSSMIKDENDNSIIDPQV